MNSPELKDSAYKVLRFLVGVAVIGCWGYVVNVRADVNRLETFREVTNEKLTQIAEDISEIKTDVKAIREGNLEPLRSEGAGPSVATRLDRIEDAVLRLQCVSVGGNNPNSPFCRDINNR